MNGETGPPGEWTQQLETLLAAAPPQARRSLARECLGEAGAVWQLFLASSPLGTVLDCASTYGSAIALARSFGGVVALVGSADVLRTGQARAASEGLTNITWLPADASPDLPFPAGAFDAVLCNGGLESVPAAERDPRAHQLTRLREIARVLKPGGRCCLVASNRFGLVLPATPRGTEEGSRWSGFLPRVVARLLARSPAGIAARRHAHSLSGYLRLAAAAQLQVIDVLVPLPALDDLSRLVGVRERGPLFRADVPARLVRPPVVAARPLLERFAPSVALVLSKLGPESRSWLDTVLSDAHVSFGGDEPGRSFDVSHCLVADSEKATLLLRPRAAKRAATPHAHGLVVKLPMTPRALERMEHNAWALEQLHGDPSLRELAALVPRPRGRGEPGGRPCFFEELVAGRPGEGAGRTPATIDRLTGEAARLLRVLHGARLSRVRIDADILDELCSEPVDEVARFFRVDPGDATIRALSVSLASRLAGADLPLVWSHGDYSLKNILANDAGSDIVGIIDWDLSRPRALPLLDLLHLLARAMMERHRESWSTVVRRRLFAGALDAADAGRVREYCEALALDASLVAPLTVAYWLDRLRGHVGTPKHLDSTWARRNFHALVEDATGALRSAREPAARVTQRDSAP